MQEYLLPPLEHVCNTPAGHPWHPSSVIDLTPDDRFPFTLASDEFNPHLACHFTLLQGPGAYCLVTDKLSAGYHHSERRIDSTSNNVQVGVSPKLRIHLAIYYRVLGQKSTLM